MPSDAVVLVAAAVVSQGSLPIAGSIWWARRNIAVQVSSLDYSKQREDLFQADLSAMSKRLDTIDKHLRKGKE